MWRRMFLFTHYISAVKINCYEQEEYIGIGIQKKLCFACLVVICLDVQINVIFVTSICLYYIIFSLI